MKDQKSTDESITGRIIIGNIPVHLLTVSQLHHKVQEVIKENKQQLFLHANAHLIQLANYEAPWLQSFFRDEVSYVMCDGSGIQLAARLLNLPIPVKIAYNVWIWTFARFLAQKGFTIFFLGADEITINKTVEQLARVEPTLRIVGASHGYFNKDKSSRENQDIIQKINAANPDVLMVGFGMPIQEKWVKENYADLSCRAVFTCGGAFDFISGNKPVAPWIFRKLYLEWFFRFLLEPARLFHRVTTSNFRFAKVLLKQAQIR
ncbi:MAG TPA: WecB/TagA/CpsF family glycosyltransferase [Chryseosolibacter sp.]